MPEINVVESKTTGIDIDALPEEQRKFIYDSHAEIIKEIPSEYFNAFNENQTKIINTISLAVKPEISELMMKKLLEQCNYIAAMQKHQIGAVPLLGDFIVTPVIEEFVEEKVFGRKREKQHYYKSSSGKRGISGGLQPSIYRKTTTPGLSRRMLEEPKKGIKLQFDSPVRCVTRKGMDYIAPSGEDIEIIGVKLQHICGVNNYPRLHEDIILMGNYSPEMFAGDCENTFTGVKQPHFPIFATELDQQTYIFSDSNPISEILDKIFYYLLNFVNFSLGFFPAVTIPKQINYIVDVGCKKTELFRGTLPEFVCSRITPSKTPTIADRIQRVNPIVAIIESKLGVTIGNDSDISLYNNLVLADLYDIYWNGVVRGPKSESFNKALESAKQKIELKKFMKNVREKELRVSKNISLYRSLISSKLGKEKLLSAEKKMGRKTYFRGDEILSYITPEERKIVIIEYERMKKQFAAEEENKCPHVEIERKFRQARTDEFMLKKFFELKKFIKVSEKPAITPGQKKHLDSSWMLVCDNCGFDLICPHVVESTELKAKKRTYPEIKAAMEKYLSDSPISSNYHCKICFEIIGNIEMYGSVMTEEHLKIYSSIADDLKTQLWSEIGGIMRYVRAGLMVNTTKIILACISTIYEFIFEVEKQLLKSKTNTAEDVMNKKRLFIAIYAYAYLTHLILNNRKNTSPDNVFDFKDIDKKLQLKGRKPNAPEYIKYSIMNILHTRNIIISQIPDATPAFIKDKIIDAFKLISMKGVQVIQFADKSEEIYNQLLIDPIYYYLYHVNVLFSGKMKASPSDFVDKLEYVMSGELSQIKKRKSVFTDVRFPKFSESEWKIKQFMELKPPEFGRVYDKSRKFLAMDAMLGYTAKSYKLFEHILKSRVFSRFVYESGETNTIPGVSLVDAGKVFTKEFSELYGLCREIEKQEKILFLYGMFAFTPLYYYFPAKTTRNYVKQNIGIDKTYDENGKLHKFDILIFSDGSEMTGKEIGDKLSEGIRVSKNVVDRRCSVCGVTYSETDKLDEKKIKESLEKINNVKNFFNHFTLRCPIYDQEHGNEHHWPESSGEIDFTCKKCGINYKYVKNNDSPGATEYYKKYSGEYEKEAKIAEQSETFRPIEQKPDETEILSKKSDEKYSSEYSKWSFDFNQVLLLSNVTKINSNLLMAYGAFEGVEYKDIISGKYTPPKPLTKFDSRIYYLESLIQELSVKYNRLRYYTNTIRPDPEITTLLDNSGIPKHEFGKLPELLPDYSESIDIKLQYFKNNKKPREIVEFCIESFARICNNIYSGNYPDAKKTKKLREDFTIYIVKKITKQQELLTKHGEIKWTIFRDEIRKMEEDEQITGEYNQNYDEDAGVIDPDEFKMRQEVDEEFGNTYDVMRNNFDIDLEPGQDIEDANELHLEDTGISGIE